MDALLLCILAAIAYTAPFIFPTYCCGLIFLFPTLLFMLIRTHPPLRSLLYWSLATTTIHLLGFCDALLHMASGPLVVRVLPPLLLIIYVACYPMIWLIFIRWIVTLAGIKQSVSRQLAVWTISTWLYIVIVDQGLLWALGRFEGSIFMNPLLPLANWPTFLFFTTFLSPPIALLWFSITSCAITATLLSPRPFIFLLLGGSLIPWLLGSGLRSIPCIPPWLGSIGHLPLLLPQTIDQSLGTLLIYNECNTLRKQHSSATTIILPESAWNGHGLASCWQFPLPPGIENLIIGGFAREDTAYFNRLYYFHKGHRANYYDKRHAVPVTERFIGHGNHLCAQLFFTNSPPVTAATTPKRVFMIPGIGILVPYICSELFCNTYPDDPYSAPILCVVNDWWFRLPHFHYLMALAARFQALRWHRPILYISFYYARFFDEVGFAVPLHTDISNNQCEKK